VRLFTPPPLPERDPRFVRGPAELCALATKWDGTVPTGGLIVQEKADGIRALWIDGRLVTREGNPIGGTSHIAAALAALEQAFGRPMMFDGEFQVDGALRPTLRHFAGGGRYGDAGHLFLFDAVPLEDWRADRCQMPLTARLEALDAAGAALVGDAVSVLRWRLCASPGAVRVAANAVWARDGEGLISKASGSLYRRRRDAAWAKVKHC
jgi:ATP-dependent DNA ligase